MRYHDPRLLQRLAPEYVLGTLHGGARRRFEQLMTESYHVRAAVWGWEQRLNPLAQAATSVQPRAEVFRAVMKRTGAQPPAPSPAWYERLGLWRGLSFAATAAAVVLAVLLATRGPQVTPTQYIAIFNGEQAQPVWVVHADPVHGRFRVHAPNPITPAANKSYELWVLPAGGAAPQSMGVLPISRTQSEHQLPESLRAVLTNAQGLAISIEPAGGSPTGAPTGPVVYQAALIAI